MTTTTILDLPIADIQIPADRARDFDQANAQALAALITAQGLFHPIRVRDTGDGYCLISGLHRLRAYEINGADTILSSVSNAATDEEARLEEVMENLGRGELIALDRCHHLYELKVVWDSMHPNFANGGGHTLPTGNDQPEIFGFASDVAEKVGLAKRTINHAVKIWTDLTPASRLRLVGTDLARKQTELKALSEQKPAMQAKILELIENEDHPDIQNVSGAVAFLERGMEVSQVEKQFKAINTAFSKLEDDALDMLVQNHADRMIAALKRMGRL